MELEPTVIKDLMLDIVEDIIEKCLSFVKGKQTVAFLTSSIIPF